MNEEEKKESGENQAPENEGEVNEKVDEVASTDEEETKPEVKKQTRDENSAYAKMRRKMEEYEKQNTQLQEQLKKQEEEFKRRESESWNDAKRRISDDDLVALRLDRDNLDSESMEIVRLYQQAKVDGDEDPVGYAYAKHYQNASKAKKEEKAYYDMCEADIKRAEINYGKDVVKEAMKQDSDFRKTYGSLINGHLNDLLGPYLRLTTKKTNEDTNEAKKMSVPPTANSGIQKGIDIDKPFEEMTAEEKHRRWVQMGYYTK